MGQEDAVLSLFRVVRASALGALAGSVALALTVWLEGIERGDPAPFSYLLPFAPLVLVAGTFCAFLGTIFFGLPVMVLLRRADAESLPAYLFAGALAGLLLAVMVGAPHQNELPYLLAYPMATAAAFWHGLRAPTLLARTDA